MPTLFFSILFGTLLFEEAAIIASLGLISQGKIDLYSAFAACFCGIFFANIGIFYFGQAASRIERLSKLKLIAKLKTQFQTPQSKAAFDISILVSRMIPGTRIPTYLGAGYFGFPQVRFIVLNLISVPLWLVALFAGGISVQKLVQDNWILAIAFAIAFFLVLKFLLPKIISRFQSR